LPGSYSRPHLSSAAAADAARDKRPQRAQPWLVTFISAESLTLSSISPMAEPERQKMYVSPLMMS
jgi:hypothetical protein